MTHVRPGDTLHPPERRPPAAVRGRIARRIRANPDAVAVLRFLAQSPDGWFASDAIQACAPVPVHPHQRFLDELVDDGLLRRRLIGQLSLYALTDHSEVRSVVLEMVTLKGPAWKK